MHPQVRLLSVAFDSSILVEMIRANRDEFMTLWLVDQTYAGGKEKY